MIPTVARKIDSHPALDVGLVHTPAHGNNRLLAVAVEGRDFGQDIHPDLGLGLGRM